jgi:nanoRNase/pAp phosphatase (c-di-AMP/oligoRNAs hydrolase)/CBS domain-containing protein
MQVAVTHSKADFDALASLVAATFLYPGAVGLLPSQMKPSVREFLGLHRDLFRVAAAGDVDLSAVTSLIVVDTNSWDRLDKPYNLSGREGLEVILWDHHVEGSTIRADWSCQAESGATITLMLREMQRRDCAFSPMHATLFLMGLYDDTGNLTYPSITPDDAYMAGYLLDNGADVHVAAAYLGDAFDADQAGVLTRVLEESRPLRVHGYEIGLAALTVAGGTGLLAPVVAKYKEIGGLDAAFGVFGLEGDKCVVIGRAGARGVNVGAVVRQMGGGGHPGAGSATVRNADPAAVRDRLAELITAQLDRPESVIRQILSPVEASIPPDTRMEAAQAMLEDKPARPLLVMDGDRLCGILGASDARKARSGGQRAAPVKAFMRTAPPTVTPEQNPRAALRLLAESDAPALPVIEDGRVVGLVTRTDLMLHLYEF